MKKNKTLIVVSSIALFFALLHLVIACSIFQDEDTVTPAQIRTCANIAQICMTNIEAAKEDDEKTVETTARCIVDWQDAGCTEIIETLSANAE